MRVLLSSYACEPGRGSEPGLGWSWASAYAQAGHDVTVLVSGDRHGAKIEAYGRENRIPFRVVFVDFWWPGERKEDLLLQRAHYLAWLIAARHAAQRLIAAGESFDLLHQVSWASVVYPCWLPKHAHLVLGPMGGAELPPVRLLAGFSPKSLAFECARAAVISTLRFSGLMSLSLGRADQIFLSNHSNDWIITPALRARSAVAVQICTDGISFAPACRRRSEGHIRLLFVGRLLDWKGIHLILATVKAIADAGEPVSCSIVAPPPSPRLLGNVRRLGLADRIRFLDAVPRHALAGIYRAHDVLLFPSLHDSGGLVVLEALANGTPVVCLDHAGPAMLVDDTCGRKVRADRGWNATVRHLRDAVMAVTAPAEFVRLSEGALARARGCTGARMMERFEASLPFGRPASAAASAPGVEVPP